MPRGESSPRECDVRVKLLQLAATRVVVCRQRSPYSTRPHHAIGSPDWLSYRSTLRFSRIMPSVPCHCLTFHRLSIRVDFVHARESVRRRKRSRRSCLKQQAAPMRPQRPRTRWYRRTAMDPCYCGRLPGALWPGCVNSHGLTLLLLTAKRRSAHYFRSSARRSAVFCSLGPKLSLTLFPCIPGQIVFFQAAQGSNRL